MRQKRFENIVSVTISKCVFILFELTAAMTFDLLQYYKYVVILSKAQPSIHVPPVLFFIHNHLKFLLLFELVASHVNSPSKIA